MRRTEANLLGIYSDISAYAASKIRSFGLPESDLEDVVHAAYFHAQKRLSTVKAKKNKRAVLKKLCWSEVMDELDNRNRRQRMAEMHTIPLDATRQTEEHDETEDDNLENDGLIVSDTGRGADTVRHFDDPETPEWVLGVRAVELSLGHTELKIVRALKSGLTLRQARLVTGLHPEKFGEKMKNLQMRFDQCFRAYHAWLAENLAITF